VQSASKIVIAAGGTAGHVVPALAVADALRAEGAAVEFIGGERAEARLVPAAGYPLHRIAVAGLSRSSPLRALRALGLAARAFVRARALLGELAPDAVLGGGGYVAGPVGLAALTRRIPLVLSEADSHLGLTNRLLAPFARRVCLSFPIEGREGGRHRITGRPITTGALDRTAARRRFGFEPEDTCVLVFGGSLGARSINLAAIEAFAGPGVADGAQADEAHDEGLQAPRRDGSLRVLHIAGRRDYPELAARTLPAGYDLRDYLDLEAFAAALAAVDLAVARAGGSVFELAAHGLPAILVPFPYASGDHQSANARWMADAGAAIVIADEQLSAERLARDAAALLADRARLARMAAASRALAKPDAAREVADELLKAAT
jgi:UDP-N-acetylglucosamine--N-acetylmuramyl-(pentapeptide) pyrophosphoryl-undecaprenol N-acetylglucosamine transferase